MTFGAEPKDYDVLEFVLQHYNELVFSPAVETETRQTADNPKLGVFLGSLVAQMVKNLHAMQETQVRSLGWEDPL